MKSPKAESLEQPKYPELECDALVHAMRERGIFVEPVPNKPYYIRLRELSTGRTIQGMTHSRGTKIHPRFLAQVLERFEIKLPDFQETLASLKRGPQRVE